MPFHKIIYGFDRGTNDPLERRYVSAGHPTATVVDDDRYTIYEGFQVYDTTNNKLYLYIGSTATTPTLAALQLDSNWMDIVDGIFVQNDYNGGTDNAALFETADPYLLLGTTTATANDNNLTELLWSSGSKITLLDITNDDDYNVETVASQLPVASIGFYSTVDSGFALTDNSANLVSDVAWTSIAEVRARGFASSAAIAGLTPAVGDTIYVYFSNTDNNNHGFFVELTIANLATDDDTLGVFTVEEIIAERGTSFINDGDGNYTVKLNTAQEIDGLAYAKWVDEADRDFEYAKLRVESNETKANDKIAKLELIVANNQTIDNDTNAVAKALSPTIDNSIIIDGDGTRVNHRLTLENVIILDGIEPPAGEPGMVLFDTNLSQFRFYENATDGFITIGGSGGGTTVTANPASDTLTALRTIQIGDVAYDNLPAPTSTERGGIFTTSTDLAIGNDGDLTLASSVALYDGTANFTTAQEFDAVTTFNEEIILDTPSGATKLRFQFQNAGVDGGFITEDTLALKGAYDGSLDTPVGQTVLMDHEVEHLQKSSTFTNVARWLARGSDGVGKTTAGQIKIQAANAEDNGSNSASADGKIVFEVALNGASANEVMVINGDDVTISKDLIIGSTTARQHTTATPTTYIGKAASGTGTIGKLDFEYGVGTTKSRVLASVVTGDGTDIDGILDLDVNYAGNFVTALKLSGTQATFDSVLALTGQTTAPDVVVGGVYFDDGTKKLRVAENSTDGWVDLFQSSSFSGTLDDTPILLRDTTTTPSGEGNNRYTFQALNNADTPAYTNVASFVPFVRSNSATGFESGFVAKANFAGTLSDIIAVNTSDQTLADTGSIVPKGVLDIRTTDEHLHILLSERGIFMEQNTDNKFGFYEDAQDNISVPRQQSWFRAGNITMENHLTANSDDFRPPSIDTGFFGNPGDNQELLSIKSRLGTTLDDNGYLNGSALNEILMSRFDGAHGLIEFRVADTYSGDIADDSNVMVLRHNSVDLTQTLNIENTSPRLDLRDTTTHSGQVAAGGEDIGAHNYSGYANGADSLRTYVDVKARIIDNTNNAEQGQYVIDTAAKDDGGERVRVASFESGRTKIEIYSLILNNGALNTSSALFGSIVESDDDDYPDRAAMQYNWDGDIYYRVFRATDDTDDTFEGDEQFWQYTGTNTTPNLDIADDDKHRVVGIKTITT